MKNYLVGYGSLIERNSRLRTTPEASTVFPVRVNGFVRGWWARIGVVGLTTTFLGCLRWKENHVINFDCDFLNGVVYEVTEEELAATDLREKGYQRTLIPHNHIVDYENALPVDAQVWIYTNDFHSASEYEGCLPSDAFPIVQSYVDICVNGCLEIEAQFSHVNGFVADFIRSTQEWSEYWINDRIYPRRPFIHQPNAYQIDQLLIDHLLDQSLFEKIKIG